MNRGKRHGEQRNGGDVVKEAGHAYRANQADDTPPADRGHLVHREERARSYFSGPGFARMLQAVWNRYASLEKVGGHAVVQNASTEECEAINAFFGWYKKPGDHIRIPLAKFERELLGSAFPYTIAELHEVLTGEPIRTKSDRQWLKARDWLALFETVEEQLMTKAGSELQPLVSDWLAGLKDGRAPGYRTLRELWRDSPEAAKRELTRSAWAWNLLLTGDAVASFRERGSLPSAIRLPVLAALATGDPHALDRNVPAGRLLFQALHASVRGKLYVEGDQAGEPRPPGLSTSVIPADEPELSPGLSFVGDSLEAREIYRHVGILDDDISSLVHIYCPWGEEAGLSVLTLRQVEKSDTDMLPSRVTDLYVVENPAVFSTLVDLTEEWMSAESPSIPGGSEFFRASGPILICTSGPASAAALRLIDRYIEERLVHGHLYYSGDFDVKGIEIGNVLASRYGSRFASWRFDRNNYLEGSAPIIQRGVLFSPEERLRLQKIRAAWDQTLCGTMEETGCKLFQEQLIMKLVIDWKISVRGGECNC